VSTTLQDLRTFVPVNKIGRRAAADMYEDFDKVEARYALWTVDGLKKLTRETLKSPMRRAILKVNKYLNNAVLPCDFKSELGVYIINSCGEKVPLTINPNIVNAHLITEYPCESECEAKCGCLPKQLCADIQTTQVKNVIRIGDTDYEETVTSQLLPSGEYRIVTTTPYEDLHNGGIRYDDKIEYVTDFDTAACGCITPSERNLAKLEAVCWDAFCCYCAPCVPGNSEFGGYNIFEENGTIHFDGALASDKIYLEYRGALPKHGNEYLIPEVAYDTLVQWTKWCSIANKKGVPKWERDDQF